jgi:hypothetical protein
MIGISKNVLLGICAEKYKQTKRVPQVFFFKHKRKFAATTTTPLKHLYLTLLKIQMSIPFFSENYVEYEYELIFHRT